MKIFVPGTEFLPETSCTNSNQFDRSDKMSKRTLSQRVYTQRGLLHRPVKETCHLVCPDIEREGFKFVPPRSRV